MSHSKSPCLKTKTGLSFLSKDPAGFSYKGISEAQVVQYALDSLRHFYQSLWISLLTRNMLPNLILSYSCIKVEHLFISTFILSRETEHHNRCILQKKKGCKKGQRKMGYFTRIQRGLLLMPLVSGNYNRACSTGTANCWTLAVITGFLRAFLDNGWRQDTIQKRQWI